MSFSVFLLSPLKGQGIPELRLLSSQPFKEPERSQYCKNLDQVWVIRHETIKVSKGHSTALLAPSIVIAAVRQCRDLCKQKGLAMSQIVLLVSKTTASSKVCIGVELLSLERTDVTGFSGNMFLSMWSMCLIPLLGLLPELHVDSTWNNYFKGKKQ